MSQSFDVSIIGAGKVGTALALLLRRRGCRIVSVISRRRASAQRAAALVGCHNFSRRISNLHPATDFLLLATPDESIQSVAHEVSLTASLDFSRLYVAHTSGMRTSDELDALKRRGASTFSFHPIQTFPQGASPATQLRSMDGVTYGVEGSQRAIRFARQLAGRLGGNVLRVPKKEKISYHLACVFASNYSVALLGAVEELARGFSPVPRLRPFRRLIQSSVDNAITLSAEKAMTGPIARGSTQSVLMHLRVLGKNHRDLEMLYKILALHTLRLIARNKTITPRRAAELRKILAL